MYSVKIFLGLRIMGCGHTHTNQDLASLLGVRPETIRTWERHSSLSPSRTIKGPRLYNENDLNRLIFVQWLLEKGLTIGYLSNYLALYPCWLRDGCRQCMSTRTRKACAKPCWKEEETFCHSALAHPNTCDKCSRNKGGTRNVTRRIAKARERMKG
jgi:MerR family transcriptional regulator/heat shock protein HspR